MIFSDQPIYQPHTEGIDAEVVLFSRRRESLWEHGSLPFKIRANGIDVFHAPADRGLPLLKMVPCVVTVHDSYERSNWRRLFPRPKNRIRYLLHEFINYFLADAVITVSNFAAKELSTLKVAPSYKIVRIYNGVSHDFSPEKQPEDDEIIRRADVSSPFVLYVGGYDPRKNVDCLVRCFDASGLHDHTLVIIARKNPEFHRLLDNWKKLQSFDRMRFLEITEKEIPSFYRKAQFFVNPSCWESFSLQLVEAMASGTPVISSNRKALPEILGDAGVYFDPADEKSLPMLMAAMAGDERLRLTLSGLGLARAESFSWDAAAKQTLAVYQRLVGAAS